MDDTAHDLDNLALDDDRTLRLPEVVLMTGLSESTLYRQIKAGQFPEQKQLSPGAVGWKLGDIRRWLQDRPAASNGRASR